MYYYGNNDWRDYLAHYGTPRHSGRYPWGSGANPRQGTVGYYQGKGKALGAGKQIIDTVKSKIRDYRKWRDKQAEYYADYVSGKFDDAPVSKRTAERYRPKRETELMYDSNPKEWLKDVTRPGGDYDQLVEKLNTKVVDLHFSTPRSLEYKKVIETFHQESDPVRVKSKKALDAMYAEEARIAKRIVEKYQLTPNSTISDEKVKEINDAFYELRDNDNRYKKKKQKYNELAEKSQAISDTYVDKAAEVALRELGIPVDNETKEIMRQWIVLS